jgi:DNA-binding NarL/FixJ family response regulator
VLAIPNSPGVVDPRGLTERESQIAWMAAAGMTNKLIAYRLGLSTSRISLCLRTAMRKLGVQTRTQLVRKIQSLPDPESG